MHRSKTARLFDHLAGDGEQVLRDVEAGRVARDASRIRREQFTRAGATARLLFAALQYKWGPTTLRQLKNYSFHGVDRLGGLDQS